jgi:hypothetical protein
MTTDSQRNDAPNDEGFAGDPTTPQPERDPRPAGEADAEQIAVPAGDLTHPISEALEGLVGDDDQPR